MNDEKHDGPEADLHPAAHRDGDLSREDQLIHRAIDGNAGVGDWAELELIARRDPGVWKRLAIGMRGELTLRRAGLALDAQLPTLPTGRPIEGKRAAILVGALGWAAAVLIGMAWLGASGLSQGTDPAPHGTAAAPEHGSLEAASLAAASGWATYLEAGTAQELEPVVLSATPSLDGAAIEVTFIRRAIEHTRVREVQEVREDDAGQISIQAVPAVRLVSNEI